MHFWSRLISDQGWWGRKKLIILIICLPIHQNISIFRNVVSISFLLSLSVTKLKKGYAGIDGGLKVKVIYSLNSNCFVG